ncbi:MAG: TonB-dependent receptor plug domain-containing protein [Bacteroidales bacterium]|nr:TonB-dependent receptor plug domain-containing protein [Bacteroidales bacterium]
MKKGIIFISFFLLTNYSYSFSKTQIFDTQFSQSIFRSFTNLWQNIPQEKVYLHTDKPYYSASEDIWFQAYVLNATTHESKNLSKFLYVELVNKVDSVIERVKIRKDSLRFAGNIKLKPDLASGYYALRAYTSWMLNEDADFIFSKTIFIGNTIDDQISCNIIYGKVIDNKLPITITFKNAYKSPITGKKIQIYTKWKNSSKKKLNSVTNSEGNVGFQLNYDLNDSSKKSIDVSIVDDEIRFQKTFFIPNFSDDFDVQFFPESGVLLGNNLQTIAFKAIASSGLSEEITGNIFTQNGTEVTDFQSTHKGMGRFIAELDASEHYYALVKSSKGIEKKVPLPKIENQGVVLHLNYHKGKFMYQITNRTSLDTKSLYLLVHTRGKVYALQQFNNLEGQISEDRLPAGVVSFAVIDSAKNTLCERLAFVDNKKTLTYELHSDKEIYGKREAVTLDFKINASTQQKVEGDFSVSITDSKTVQADSLSNNIVSYLLLTSDLKGFIEDPAYYIKNESSTHDNLDLLMLTQGWRRFNTADIVKGIYKKHTSYLEIGQEISGTVKNFIGKPSKNCDIIMLALGKSMMKMVKTDSLGRFSMNGIEFEDSTQFILKAKKRKSLTDVEIIPDLDIFPKLSTYIYEPRKVESSAQLDYLNQSKEKYYYEGGMRIINLNEVVIDGGKSKPQSDEPFYSGMEEEERTTKDFEKFQGISLLSYLQTISGIQVNGDAVSIRGNGGSPLFLIDGVESEDSSSLSYFMMTDIENISVFKGVSASIFGSRGGNGVIAITLKKGTTVNTSPSISMTTIMPLGYQKPAQFYQPKYEVDSIRRTSIPDLRTTIYWNPQLKSDSTGNVRFKFFTADKPNDYTVTIEGVTNDGTICRYVGALRRENP